MPFRLTPYELPGLALLDGDVWRDDRGFFMESFRESAFGNGAPRFVQDNFSRSRKGVLRGMHYQKDPSSIGKLVRCLRGRVFDVALDLRRGSPSYGRWAAVELCEGSNRALWVPAGFAHGFQVVSEEADVHYKVTGYWAPEYERGVLWSDPEVGIRWPIKDALVTPKDAQFPPLSRADNNFVWKD